MIIVIDGPAGSGKSSTAKAVADKMDIQYLDSGALYRAVTWQALESGIDNKQMLFDMLDDVSLTFEYKKGQFHVFINKEDITDRLREPRVTEKVSEIAALAPVRSYINRCMNEAIQEGIYIAEGRDLGTAVFPDADIKIYMLADVRERARRRYQELHKKGIDTTLEEVQSQLEERDRKDEKRDRDPLKKSDDAIVIDTTNTTFEQQVSFICSAIQNELENNSTINK